MIYALIAYYIFSIFVMLTWIAKNDRYIIIRDVIGAFVLGWAISPFYAIALVGEFLNIKSFDDFLDIELWRRKKMKALDRIKRIDESIRDENVSLSHVIWLTETLKGALEVLEYYKELGPAMAEGACIADGGDKAKEFLERLEKNE